MISKKIQILNDLYSLQRFGIKPGLERTEYILKKAGNPHKSLKCIHIAGTNGKGTVCGTIASILIEAGCKTALYTSPHISKFNERFLINGKMIDDDELVSLAEEFMEYGRECGATFFEITTAMAFKYFARNNPDFCVIETGMGGRFDSTNVIEPVLTVITEIGLEHTQYLGDTIEKIAFEKAGIIKKNVPVICSVRKSDALKVIKDIAAEKSSEFISPCNLFKIRKIRYNDDITMSFSLFSENNPPLKILSPFAGEHQIRNILTSVSAVKKLGNFNDEYISTGIKKAKENSAIKGRIELIRKNPPFVIDSAHNPEALEMLSDTLQKCLGDNMEWTVLFAAMNDKDVSKMLKAIKPLCRQLIITKPPNERSLEPAAISSEAGLLGFNNIILSEHSQEAADLLFRQNTPSLVCGSFFLLGSIDFTLLMNNYFV